jgi:hypothetical protein
VIACGAIGVILNQMADVAIVGLFADSAATHKSKRIDRLITRALFRVFHFRRLSDPQVNVIRRYLESPRRKWFLEMATLWADTTPLRIDQPEEAIAVHQHILARLAALSEQSRAALKDAYSEVVMASSLFLSLVAVLVSALLSLWSSHALGPQFVTQPVPVLLSTIGVIYCITIASAYVVKRRFANFCALTITQALHYFRVTVGQTYTPLDLQYIEATKS